MSHTKYPMIFFIATADRFPDLCQSSQVSWELKRIKTHLSIRSSDIYMQVPFILTKCFSYYSLNNYFNQCENLHAHSVLSKRPKKSSNPILITLNHFILIDNNQNQIPKKKIDKRELHKKHMLSYDNRIPQTDLLR